MSTLILVRHGQAAFLEDDYDRLRPSGEQQARLLGAWWARHRLHPDRVVTGPRTRQRRTAELVGEELARAGLPWPEVEVLDALDEYRADVVMQRAIPDLVVRDPEVARLVEAWAATPPSERAARGRAFELLFQSVAHRWARGELDLPGVESWPEFLARVRAGFEHLTAGDTGRGRRVVAFTSAGAIGASLQLALGLDAAKGLELGWIVRNCSLTEFLFTAGRVTLTAFNAIPHLDDPTLWTHR